MLAKQSRTGATADAMLGEKNSLLIISGEF
jgi:hypothetical protein